MKKYSEEWNEINKLLSYMHVGGFDVVDLVDLHYLRYGNDAPGLLLRAQIEKVQALLDKAE